MRDPFDDDPLHPSPGVVALLYVCVTIVILAMIWGGTQL